MVRCRVFRSVVFRQSTFVKVRSVQASISCGSRGCSSWGGFRSGMLWQSRRCNARYESVSFVKAVVVNYAEAARGSFR